MAMEHERIGVAGVVVELGDERDRGALGQIERVLPALLIFGDVAIGPRKDAELDVMQVEGVPEDVVVLNGPDLGGAELHDHVRGVHVERLAIEGEVRAAVGDADRPLGRGFLLADEHVTGEDLGHLGDRLGGRRADVDAQQAVIVVVQIAAVGTAGVQLATRETEGLIRIIGHQVDRAADLVRAEVDEDLGAFAHHEGQALQRDGLVDQAAVGGDLVEDAIIAEAQDITPLDLGVEDAQTDKLAGQLRLGVERAVGQLIIAVLVVVAVVGELVVLEASAREHERQVVDAVGARQGQLRFERIADDDQATRAHRQLLLRGFMQVRVIPIGACVVLHHERR